MLAVATFAALASISVNAQAPYKLPPLQYSYSGLENYIDTETMFLHHTRHHNASVNNLNTALKSAKSLSTLKLTTLLKTLKGKDTVTTAIRNNAGSHFNHAQFWRNLRPTWYNFNPALPKNVRSPALNNAINKAFGSYSNFNATFSTAASQLFGSGWTWLIYKPATKSLAVVSTPNQDNPLMTNIVAPELQGIPILGIDVWEHAYYLKVRNMRNRYIANWWQVVNWPQVSSNYQNAIKGNLEALWRQA